MRDDNLDIWVAEVLERQVYRDGIIITICDRVRSWFR